MSGKGEGKEPGGPEMGLEEDTLMRIDQTEVLSGDTETRELLVTVPLPSSTLGGGKLPIQEGAEAPEAGLAQKALATSVTARLGSILWRVASTVGVKWKKEGGREDDEGGEEEGLDDEELEEWEGVLDQSEEWAQSPEVRARLRMESSSSVARRRSHGALTPAF